ncbi:MAG: FecR family protein [Candidatus Acidiferrales bacterium]
MKTISSVRTSDLTGFVSSCRMLLRRSYFPCLLFLAGILVCAAAPGPSAFGATSAHDPAASATSITGKDAKLNGTPMPVGATLFPGDVIRLGEASTAGLRFGNSMVLAAPLTELVVESEGVSLRIGRLQVRADGAESFAVSGPYFHVKIAASEGVPSSAEVRLAGPRAQVSAVAGGADLTAAGSETSYRVRAGETATLDATGGDASPAQGASSPAAGQISRLAPQVQIDRGSQVLVAAVSNRIYWNDDLRSGPTGRAHIALNDGSQLNLGSDSSLRILQHDAQAQQTSLDLLVGRMRGKITKLTRPGAKFEIHTPVGIAGLVGTDFSLLVTNDYTELMVFEGAVRFTNLSGQSVSVTAGNILRISKAGAFEGPSPATPQDVQTTQNLTDITTTTTAANQAPVAAVATRSIVPVVVTLTGTAAAIGIGVWQGTRPTVSNTIP